MVLRFFSTLGYLYEGHPICSDNGLIKQNLLRGCQLSKTNICIIFTCIKKNDNFSKETGHS